MRPSATAPWADGQHSPCRSRPQTYVGLLYGYLYTDGDLARVYGGQQQQQQPEAASSSGSGLKDLLGGRENDRPQYEEYEQGVLRDLLGVFGVMTLPPVAASPPSVSSHAICCCLRFRALF